MNKLGKLVLMATSLTPILGAFAVNYFAHQDWWKGGICLGFAFLLALICWGVILRCRRILAEEPLVTKKVKTADKEVVTFLLVYLLPLFTKDLIFTGNWLTPIYIVMVIALCVYHSNAFSFNPLLSIVGYHFYEVENENGMNYLLISTKTIHRHDNMLRVRQLADYIYLDG